jgi:branched-chain amino acid aminotransferase
VRSIDKYKIGTGERGEVTKALQDAYFDIIRNGNDKHGWLTFLPERKAKTNGVRKEAIKA